MTEADARDALNLDATAALERDTVRRAYMRAVKQHTPEADPAGFARVRAAHDLLLHKVAVRERASIADDGEAADQENPGFPSVNDEPEANGDAFDQALDAISNALLASDFTEAHERVRALVDTPDADDIRHVHPGALLRWGQLRAIDGLAEDLPAPILCALVEFYASGDVDKARFTLARFSRRNPRQAAEAARIIRLLNRDFHEVWADVWPADPTSALVATASTRAAEWKRVARTLWIVGCIVLWICYFFIWKSEPKATRPAPSTEPAPGAAPVREEFSSPPDASPATVDSGGL